VAGVGASKWGKYGVRNRPRKHGRKPAGEASACHLRVRLPFAVQVHAPFPPPPVSIDLYNRASPTRPLPAGEAACSRHEQSTLSSHLPLPARRPPAPRSGRPPPASALRPPDRAGADPAFSGEFPAFLCFARASVGSVIRACGVVLYAWNGFGVEFGSFYALLSAETGDP
jgi:hypothetical protein